jgi:hypothetical protein
VAGIIVDRVRLPEPLAMTWNKLHAADMYEDAPFWSVAGSAQSLAAWSEPDDHGAKADQA